MILAALACAATMAQSPSYEVRWKGEMRRVMRDGDLTDHVDLRDLAGTPHLYAIGPVSGLRGEITILDSKASIARVVNGKPVVSAGFDLQAPFLVWAQVARWREVPLAEPVKDLAALERLVEVQAKRAGLDLTKPIPFRVRGVATGTYHIVNRRGNTRPSHAEHAKIQVRFPLRSVPVEAVGFWSDRHHGVWTHHGENVHVHLRTADGRGSGHADVLRFGRSVVLLLPAK